MVNSYYDEATMADEVAAGRHREVIGGLWDAVGQLQIDFLVDRGLRPDMNVIDIGCGSLRAGIHLVRFLEADRYYGIDVSQSLLDAGYDIELAAAGLQQDLPRSHLLCDEGFRADRFGASFDVGLAQSVFTHLPWNHLRLCLDRLAGSMKPGAVFYATAFVCEPGDEWAQELHHPVGDITSHPTQDPFHYRLEDIRAAADALPWSVELLGRWGHPRDVQMVAFHRSG